MRAPHRPEPCDPRVPAAGHRLVIDSLMEFYRQGRSEKDFELGVETALARVLASPQFIYRIEQQPRTLRQGSPIASTISILRRGCRFSCGAARPTTRC
jgi:hypothetical protein